MLAENEFNNSNINGTEAIRNEIVTLNVQLDTEFY